MFNWDELKRRNVVKVGITYFALGWLVLQVTSLAVPALNLPESLNSIVFYLGMIGFPFALFFAWAFELTPEGIKKTKDVIPDNSITSLTGRNLDYVIIALLVTAVAFLSFRLNSHSSQDSPQANINEDGAKSIAVLPFVNMSGDPENEYFSDGISEEILDGLSKVKGLRVIARTSSFHFKNKEVSIAEIGSKLKVETVLEGSVRKLGERVRITAQLIRVSDESHLWSKVYERELSDIFQLQDEISKTIVSALHPSLGLSSDEQLVTKKTDNLEAYNAFLKGKGNTIWGNPNGLEASIQHMKRATKLDPEYAEAYGYLALAYLSSAVFQPSNKVLANMQAATEQALLLDPLQPEATIVKAYLHLFNTWDWGVADKMFQRALKNSNNSNLLGFYGIFILFNTDQIEEAQRVMKAAIELDPYYPAYYSGLAYTYNLQGKSEESLQYHQRAIALGPNNIALLQTYIVGLCWSGKFEEAEKAIKKLERLTDERSRFIVRDAQIELSLARGNTNRARELLAVQESTLEQHGHYLVTAEQYLRLKNVEKAQDLLSQPLLNTNAYGIINLSLLKNRPATEAFIKRVRLDPESMRAMGFPVK